MEWLNQPSIVISPELAAKIQCGRARASALIEQLEFISFDSRKVVANSRRRVEELETLVLEASDPYPLLEQLRETRNSLQPQLKPAEVPPALEECFSSGTSEHIPLKRFRF